MVTVVNSPGLAVAGPKICFISQTVDIIHPDATRACSIVRVGQWYHDTPVNKRCDLPISAKWEESKDVLENYSHGFLLKIFSYCENNWHSNSPSDDHYMDGADTYVGLFRALHTTVASGIPQPSSQTVPHWLLWKTSTLPLFEVPFTRRTFIVSIWPTNGNVKHPQSVEWNLPCILFQCALHKVYRVWNSVSSFSSHLLVWQATPMSSVWSQSLVPQGLWPHSPIEDSVPVQLVPSSQIGP